MIRISHIPCCYGNSVVMAARVKPGNKQHLGHDTRKASHGKVTSICLCFHGYNISILTSEQFNEIAQKALCLPIMKFIIFQMPK